MDSAAPRERAAPGGPPPGAASATPEFLPPPSRGRVFRARRVVRSTDVTPDSRLRFDALARYLQEVAEDDVADTGWREPYGWLLRRCAVTVRAYPSWGEAVGLTTFCSATGPRWAERTTTLAGPDGDLMQAVAVWVAVAPATGRPCELGPEFHRWYGPSAEGRVVSARLTHPGPPGAGAARAWPLRASDFDTVGHVNNTVHWAAVEDALAESDWLPAGADIEYQRPILPGDEPGLVTSQSTDELRVWLLRGARALASARLTRG